MSYVRCDIEVPEQAIYRREDMVLVKPGAGPAKVLATIGKVVGQDESICLNAAIKAPSVREIEEVLRGTILLSLSSRLAPIASQLWYL